MRLPTLPRALAAGRRWWPMVIEIILAAVASGLVINIYRKTGQRELRRLNKLNG